RCFDRDHGASDHDFASVALSPDGRRALAGNRAGTVWLWDLETGQQLGRCDHRREDGRAAAINDVTFSPDRHRALFSSGDGWARVWDVETWTELRRFREEGGLWSGEISPDGRTALIAGGMLNRENTPILSLWDLESGQRLRCFEGHEKGVFRAVFSP